MVAIVVILLGTGAYEVSKPKAPVNDVPATVAATGTSDALSATSVPPAGTAPAATATPPAADSDDSAANVATTTSADAVTPPATAPAAATPVTAAAPDASTPLPAPSDVAASATSIPDTIASATAAPDGSTSAGVSPDAGGNAVPNASATPPTAETPDAAGAGPAPSFDIVRVDPDGSMVVAGQVAAGAHVSIRVDGAEVASSTADGSGKFVALFNLPSASAGRLMTMVATMTDGTQAEAGAAVALAATTAPALATAAVAEATTAPGATGIASTTPPKPDAAFGVAASTTAPAASGTAALTASDSAGNADGTGAVTAATDAPQTTPASDQTEPQTGTVAGAQSAPAAGTVALAVSDQGAKVLQPATALTPEMAKNVTLDTIAYPSATEVQFGGRGKPGAFVRIYLNNAPFGSAIAVGPDGTWNVTDAGIAPKIYTLRVDEVDAAGKVVSRYETPFKRETPAALAAVMGTAATGSAENGTTKAGLATTDATTLSGSTAASAVGQSAAATVQPALVNVTVQPGYTLWGIARRQMGHGILYVQVWNANKDKIRNPNLIYPGQVFSLPQN